MLGEKQTSLAARPKIQIWRAPGSYQPIGPGIIGGGNVDLTISNLVILSPATIGCGQQTIFFSARETNLGTDHSESYWTHSLFDGGFGGTPNTLISGISRPSLPGGTTRTFIASFPHYTGPCKCQPTNRTFQYRLRTDGPDQVAETNELNNHSNIVSKAYQCP